MLPSLRALPVNGNLPDDMLTLVLDEVPRISDQPVYRVAIGFANYHNDTLPVPSSVLCRTFVEILHLRISNEWLRGMTSLAWLKAGRALRYQVVNTNLQPLQDRGGAEQVSVNEYNWSPDRLLERMIKELVDSMRLRLGNGFVVSVNTTDAILPGTFILRHSYGNDRDGFWPTNDYTTQDGLPAIHTITVHAFPMARVMNTSRRGYSLGGDFTHRP
jgi:hypothetical protein